MVEFILMWGVFGLLGVAAFIYLIIGYTIGNYWPGAVLRALWP